MHSIFIHIVVNRHSTKTYAQCMAPVILTSALGAVCSFMLQPIYPWEQNPRYPLNRKLGGPQRQSGRFGEEKVKCLWEPNLGSSVVQRVQCHSPFWVVPASCFYAINLNKFKKIRPAGSEWYRRTGRLGVVHRRVSRLCEFVLEHEQDMQCTYNVTLRHVRLIIAAVEKQ
jgi:hypothetical protein